MRGLKAMSIGAALARISAARDFSDEDIVFLMPVYRDADVAFRALKRLRTHYPKSRVILLSDGDGLFPYEKFVQAFGVEYVLGENLYGMEHGGAMMHRMLDLYMKKPARWFVRLDSDARIDRRFRYLPRMQGLYGRIGDRSGVVQGGCILLSHKAAEQLHASRIFLSERLLDAENSWGKYSTPENLQRKLEEKRVAYDKVLHWGCVEQKVPVYPFPEIFAVWKRTPDFMPQLANGDRRYAVVHPDKMEQE